jgi:hypothetical protein
LPWPWWVWRRTRWQVGAGRPVAGVLQKFSARTPAPGQTTALARMAETDRLQTSATMERTALIAGHEVRPLPPTLSLSSLSDSLSTLANVDVDVSSHIEEDRSLHAQPLPALPLPPPAAPTAMHTSRATPNRPAVSSQHTSPPPPHTHTATRTHAHTHTHAGYVNTDLQAGTAEQGDPGFPGNQGPQGAAGTDGAPGNPGSDGTPGSDGVPGEAGSQGEMGPQGDQGDAGLDGVDGITGARGTKGSSGDAGEEGVTGLKGAKGPQGEPNNAHSSIGIRTASLVTVHFTFTECTREISSVSFCLYNPIIKTHLAPRAVCCR